MGGVTQDYFQCPLDFIVNLPNGYNTMVAEVWPKLDLKVMQQVAHVRSEFRLAAAIDWVRVRFSPAYPERTMWCMVKYRDRLRGSLEVVP
jgi:hypothetical protein